MRRLMFVLSQLCGRARLGHRDRLFDIQLGDWFPQVL
jgi:hypothetical protein